MNHFLIMSNNNNTVNVSLDVEFWELSEITD